MADLEGSDKAMIKALSRQELKKKKKKMYLYVHECLAPTYVYVCISCMYMHAWCLLSLRDRIMCPGTRITDGGEPLCGCWNLCKSSQCP